MQCRGGLCKCWSFDDQAALGVSSVLDSVHAWRPGSGGPAALGVLPLAFKKRGSLAVTLQDPSGYPVAQWILFLVQIGTLIGLIVYVLKTWHMASATERAAKAASETVAEMQRARIEALAPRVLVYFSSPDSHLANIVIENLGQSTATDVRLTFVPPLVSSLQPSDLSFFSTPKVLPPRFRLVHLFDSWPQYFGKKLPERYDVTVTYRRADTGQEVTDQQMLDAGGFAHLHFTTRKDVHDLVAECEKLRTMLDGRLREQGTARQAIVTTGELLDQLLAPADAVRQARAVWALFRAADAAPNVLVSQRGFLAAARQLVVAALRNSPPAVQRAALEKLYLSLSDHRFETIGDQTEYEQAVDAALSEAESAIAG